jgi:RNA polymerase sigma-70 factor (family 1)
MQFMETGVEANITLLLQQLKEGSEPAFNALYKLHSKMLLSNIRNLVKDNEIAKELLQDLYLKIWENREKIDTGKSFKSFLFTVAKNMVYDYLRRASLDKRAKVRLMTNAIEFYTHTEEALDYKESHALINVAVETLPAQCRQVYTLSKLEGKSHQEISLELGISVSTVNNHMVKANREVRAYLLRHGDLAIAFLVSTVIHYI